MILEDDWLQNADRSRGRFRSLLLKSLKNFLNDAADKIHARKRGGDVSFISWDDWITEAPSQLSMSTERLNSLPAERLFDVRWAATVVERALRRLREECRAQRAAASFRRLKRLSHGGAGRCFLREFGHEVGVSSEVR